MARPEKIAIVDEIAEKIERTKSLFLTDFTGLDVEAINELRRLLRENAVEYRVVKNTLARLAVEKAGREDLKPYLVGPTAMAFGFEDPTLPAKLLSRFAQKTGKPTVKAIVFEEQLYGQEVMARLKGLPSREELLSQMVSGLKAPITQITMVLGGLLRSLMGTLEAIRRAMDEGEQKEKDVPAEERDEEKVEAKPKDEAELEAEGKAGQRAETGPEEKAENKAKAKVPAKEKQEAEDTSGQEQKSAEEAQPKPEGEKSPGGEDDHEAEATGPKEAKEEESPGEEQENIQRQKG